MLLERRENARVAIRGIVLSKTRADVGQKKIGLVDDSQQCVLVPWGGCLSFLAVACVKGHEARSTGDVCRAGS